VVYYQFYFTLANQINENKFLVTLASELVGRAAAPAHTPSFAGQLFCRVYGPY
jgi:hypothetical protein